MICKLLLSKEQPNSLCHVHRVQLKNEMPTCLLTFRCIVVVDQTPRIVCAPPDFEVLLHEQVLGDKRRLHIPKQQQMLHLLEEIGSRADLLDGRQADA